MGYAIKDKNMNHQYRPSSSSVKQGYLHIKRERTSSLFVKPWQQAYFILRRDPFIMEEYKDASLKTQKQLHLIGTIKHVGIIRTSKSQQFAFEVVMLEKTPLLFACENQILLEEWISAFIEVMNTVSEIEHTKTPSSLRNIHPSLERKGSMHDAYRVAVVESALSRANELLVDEYYLTLTPSRMSLLALGDLNEVLSWPIGHVTYYTSQPNVNQVILIMGRACHFGSGKLIFESKQYDQIVKCIEIFHTKSPKNRTSTGSAGGRSCNSGSSAGSNNSNSLSDKSPLSISCDDETPVFDSPIPDKVSNKFNKLIKEDKTRSFSFPEVSEKDKSINNHKKLQRSEECYSDFQNDNAIISKKRAQTDPNSTESSYNFAAITSEDGYVEPNEPDLNTARAQFSMLSRSHCDTQNESPSRSPNGSDNENEISSSYLQIVDSDENVDDPVAKRILDDITSSLTDPMNNHSYLTNLSASNVGKKSIQQETSLKYKLENRRCSEPGKKTNVIRSFDKEQAKLKITKKTSHSVDCVEHTHTSIDFLSKSPQIMAKHQQNSPLMPRTYNKHASPKVQSISQGNHMSSNKPSSNPFDKLESFFMINRSMPLSQSFNSMQLSKATFGMRRNNTDSVLSSVIKIPELDRNRKPKPYQGKPLEVPNVPSVSSLKIENLEGVDGPPPVPERQSPKLLRSQGRSKLQREPELREEEEEYLNSESDNIENNTENIDENTIETNSSSKESVESTDNKTKVASGLLAPPPLPPKSKPLSSTKSAPIPARESEETEENKETLTRCASLNSDLRLNDEITDISYNGPIVVKCDQRNGDVSTVNEEDVPPEVPCRRPVHPLAKRKHLSTSEGNLLRSNFVELKNNRKTQNNNCNHVGSKSVEQLQFSQILTNDNKTDSWHKLKKVNSSRRITIHEFDLQAPICDEGLKTVIPILPKIMTPSSSSFPRAPKKFL